jgi:hypothetical protein
MTRTWRGVVAAVALVNVAALSGQGIDLERVMRAKLACSQKILEAVVTSHWSDIETQSRELESLTNDPAWMVLNSPEYVRHSAAFRKTVQALHDAAARRELDATPKAYVAMTLSCVECHRYLARSRIAH